MTFTSNIFLIGILPWSVLLFYLTRNQRYSKKIIIFLVNSIFYIWGGIGAFIFVCLFTTIVWFFSAIAAKNKSKILFGILLFITLIPLLAIKYSGFAILNINSIFNYGIQAPDFIMPIGISFFTFEALSLLCDIYLGKTTYKISIIDVYLYLTFFPTVISGPIIRFQEFKNGFSNRIDTANCGLAIERIALGLCKKVLIADKIAVLADYYFDGVACGNMYSSLGLWVGSISYTLQLYFDFSGYTDMAIGIGQLLGFNIRENFDRPYQANSISDFWKRWHISLSQWFRDYVYIPLGGNRCSVPRHILNLFIVWVLTGIWHGADWSFVVWGMGYFVLLTIEKYVPAMKNIGTHWWGHLYAVFLINFLWIPFRASNLAVAIRYIAGMFSWGANGLGKIEDKALSFLPYLVFIVLICFPWNRKFEKFNQKWWFKIIKGVLLILLVGLSVCAVINSSYAPYIYGNF